MHLGDWLKKRSPPAGPPSPGHVDQATLLEQLHEKERLGIATAATRFLSTQAPPVRYDKWGQAFPLSAYDQERLDQQVAIMAAPLERGRALLHAGMITPAEMDALIAVYPDIASILIDEAIDDMVAHPPPYEAWAESTLGVLFGMPPAQVYGTGTPMKAEQTESLKGRTKKGTEADVPSTPSERREVAVREMRS